jgi:hypothetical protein
MSAINNVLDEVWVEKTPSQDDVIAAQIELENIITTLKGMRMRLAIIARNGYCNNEKPAREMVEKIDELLKEIK